MTSKPTKEDGSVEFSEKRAKMRSKSRRHCGWSSASTTTQKYETGEKNRLEMFVQMGTTLSRFTGITLGCVVYQKTSGLPIVGDS
jgi:ribosomal protein L21E